MSMSLAVPKIIAVASPLVTPSQLQAFAHSDLARNRVLTYLAVAIHQLQFQLLCISDRNRKRIRKYRAIATLFRLV